MRTFALTLLLVSLTATTSLADETLEKLTEENKQLRAENAELKKRIADLEARIGIVPPKPQTSQPANADALAAENQELKRKLEAAEAAKTDLQSERTRLEQLAGMTTKGELVESKVALIRTNYDSAADRTTVASTPEPIQGPGGLQLVDHRMTLAYSYPGKSPATTIDAYTFDLLTIENVDDRYKLIKDIPFTIDGQTITIPVTSYDVLDTKTRTTGTRPGSKPLKAYNERLRLTLTPDQLQHIARATDVKLKLLKTTFTLTRENIATFVAIRERVDMGTSGK